MGTSTIFLALLLVYVTVESSFAQDVQPQRRLTPLMINFPQTNENNNDIDNFFGAQQLLPPPWMQSAGDTNGGFPSGLFEMPMRRPPSPFFMPPIRPNPYFERMMEQMNKQGEIMRKEMDKLPTTSETSEDVITLPGGRKFVKRCKTTKRGSGAVMMMETVCKLIPQTSDLETNIDTVTPSVLPNGEQPTDNQQAIPSETILNGDETAPSDSQQQPDNSTPNERTNVQDDELKRQDVEDNGETMTMSKNKVAAR